MQMKGRRVRVFHQQQVGEEFERAVGHLLGIKGVFETAVIETEQQPAVFGALRVNLVNAWNPAGDFA